MNGSTQKPLMPLVRELEGKSNALRLVTIQKWLSEWRVPHQLQAYATGVNLLVRSFRKPFIGISCHFDTAPNCPGANANASAVAVVLSLVRKSLLTPTENLGIQFFFFDEEERGLKGSQAYTDQMGTRGMMGLLNLEMVGMGDQFAIWPLNENSEGSLLQAFERQCDQEGVIAQRFDGIITNRSDHESFRDAGIPDAFTITRISARDAEVAQHYYKAQEFEVDLDVLQEILSDAPLFQHYHQTSDLSVHLQEKSLAETADVLWATVLELDRKYMFPGFLT